MGRTATATSIRGHLLAGAAALVLCGGGMASWAAGTQVSGAIVASGVLVVDSYTKKVQHQTGGIVKEIRVKDGDAVSAGDLLLRFDETVARANLAVITNELDQLAAASARAQAEQAGAETIRFPVDLLQRRGQEPMVTQLTDGVASQFKAGLAARSGQRAQLAQRVVQLRMQLDGLGKQITAKKRELALIATELVGVRELAEKKLVSVTRVNALDRDDAKAQGDLGQLTSTLGEVGGRIAETELQILQIDQDLRKEDEKELEANRTRTSELTERKIAALDQLTRLDVRAPQGGRVQEMSVHTIGGVVAPQSEPIMLIVPEADVLKVEAKVLPQDVDQLRSGERVVVRLSGLNQRTTPELEGSLITVSADSIIDAKTGASFFRVRVDLPEAEISKLHGIRLLPGMPCEVFIETSEPRTIASYLAKPIRDQMVKAFR